MTKRGGRRSRLQLNACGKCRLLKLHTLKILLLKLLLVTPVCQTHNKATIHSNYSSLLLQTITAPTSTKKVSPLAATELHLQKFQQREISNCSENRTSYLTSQEINVDASSTNKVDLSSLVKDMPQCGFLQELRKPSSGREILETGHVDSSITLGSNLQLNESNSTRVLADLPSRKLSGGNYTEMMASIFEDAEFSASFRANVNDRHDDDRMSNKFNSCYLRCGEDNNYPCSCAEKCVVNLNCCEDFADKCPALLDLALSNFDHLLFASVRCDDRLAVFMVDSCPSILNEDRRPSRENNTYSDNIPSAIASQQSTKAETTYKVSSIQGILSNAPLTDFTTGMVYANANIYECNRRTPQNNFTQGKGVTWLTYFGTKNNTIPKTVKTLHEQLDLESYSYMPPESHPVISGSMCYNKWTVSCISRHSDRLGLQNVACNMSVGDYYQSRIDLLTKFWTDKLLAEHVCASCILEYQVFSGQGGRNAVTGFKVLASLSESQGKVSFDTSDTSYQHGRQRWVPWRTVTCDVPDSRVLADTGDKRTTTCQTLNCQKDFSLLQDGACKKAVSLELQLLGDVKFHGQTCHIIPEQFFSAAACYLRRFHTLVATTKPIRVSRGFDTGQQINLTIIRAEMYFEEDSFEDLLFDLSFMYEPFLAAMLVYVENFCYTKSQNSYLLSATQQLKGHMVKAWGPNNLLNNSIGFKYCLAFYDYEDSTPDDHLLECYISNEYQNKLRPGLQRKAIISKAMGLKCLREESDDLTSTGVHFCPPNVFVYVIIFMLLYRRCMKTLKVTTP
ncbi:hypothetical protein ElyMa_003901900 [Elysia marginata]|uniref:SMB domain-containing protein n=1 Tax=Elysia marginata TaxID=1093978 RepID=A0AAV4FNA6_9GAST|nr:hypothetical protein ElyMa_003901900 [Elysia marginata]